MPSTRELRRRIRSIKNTSQITKAMEMVAATKMRRAQTQTLNARPYSQTLSHLLLNLLKSGQEMNHPLLKSNGSNKTSVLLITTDKSLCGALNTNLFRLIQKEDKQLNYFYSIGKKGRNFIVKTGRDLKADFENLETISFAQARQIRRSLTHDFIRGEVGEVSLIFSNFISTLRQDPMIIKLLPVSTDKLIDFLEDSNYIKDQQVDLKETNKPDDYLIEPALTTLLDYTLNHYLDMIIYQALLESKASEHSARMMAMQNANKNASELVSDLTLAYNQTRQEAITKELLEITTASLALE